MIIACALLSSGLMPISGLLLLIVSFFYNPAKIILNIKAIPLEIKHKLMGTLGIYNWNSCKY